jgi:hypothetical protein
VTEGDGRPPRSIAGMTYEEEIAARSAAMVTGMSHFMEGPRINATTTPETRRVRCPRCGAPAGETCVGDRGVPRKKNHIERVRARLEAVVDG